MADISEAELHAWYLFDRLEPITLWEQRLQIGELAAVTYNQGRHADAQGRLPPAMSRDDFLVRDRQEQIAVDNSNLINALRKIAKPYTGKKKRRH